MGEMRVSIRNMKDREICLDNSSGRKEYRRRTLEMRERQGELCCLCAKWMSEEETSFEHQDGRGGGKRNDAIWKEGQRYNGASHSLCNGARGSRRTPFLIQ